MKSYTKKNNILGFSLTEMLVSLGVISIIATVMYGNYPSVNKFVSYTTAINDFASQVKEVQIYGASRGGVTAKGDGIYIATNTPYYYYLFNDAINSSSSATGIGTSNLLWDGAGLEATTTKSYLNSTYITRICRDDNEYYGTTTVASVFTCDLPNLMVVFSRPKLNANLAYINNSGATSTVRQACIELGQVGVSTSTQQRSVIIKPSGQITVQKARCTQ